MLFPQCWQNNVLEDTLFPHLEQVIFFMSSIVFAISKMLSSWTWFSSACFDIEYVQNKDRNDITNDNIDSIMSIVTVSERNEDVS